jgi:hypothetical protein
MLLVNQLVGFGVGGAGYRPQGVNFDATNDYLTRGAGLTGASDGKQYTLSMWGRITSDTLCRGLGSFTTVGGTTFRFLMQRISATEASQGTVQILAYNSAGTLISNLQSSTNAMDPADGWVHILASANLANASAKHLYIDDVSDLFASTHTDDTIDWTVSDWAFGALGDGTTKWNGDVADVLFWTSYIDLSSVTNRRLFIDGFGKPVDPEVSIATMGTPIIRFSGPTSDWHTNKGSGGGFTENGAITDSTSSPGD